MHTWILDEPYKNYAFTITIWRKFHVDLSFVNYQNTDIREHNFKKKNKKRNVEITEYVLLGLVVSN